MEENSVDLAGSGAGRVVRTFGVVAVIGLLLAVIISSLMTKPAPVEQAWNVGMTMGSEEASRHYIMYTDLMCPYCDVFSRVVMANQEKFDQYLEEHNILFEIRMTDYLNVASGSENSRAAAEASYCAARDGKFWEFYHGAIQALWDDYHSKGIGSSKTAEPIKDMPEDYWLEIGLSAGLGEGFEKCVAEGEAEEELDKNTTRALQAAQGMPYFKFGNFTTSGFGENWGWEYVEMMLNEGL